MPAREVRASVLYLPMHNNGFVSAVKGIATSVFTHLCLKNETLISAENDSLSEQRNNIAQPVAKAGALGKLGTLNSKTNKSQTDASTTPSSDDIKTALTLSTADESRGHACTTFIAYIKSMGGGWFGSAMLMAFIGYARYVECLCWECNTPALSRLHLCG